MNILERADPEIWQAIQGERRRQQTGLEMIASENYTSSAVMAAQGSELTNKYAEGYPGKRYYGGCEFVDVAERLAIERVLRCSTRTGPMSSRIPAAQANMSVFLACLNPGDTILAMDLAHGGHLTHGMRLNFSGKFYRIVSYGVRKEDERIDFDQVAHLARENKPKLVIAGASAYAREIDFGRFAEICSEVKALFMVDMAHIAGLVAAGLHADPVPCADFVTSTTHKTLRGPRGGFVLCKQDWIQKINQAVFPGLQGGPLMHVIAGKAVAFGEAAQAGIQSLFFADHQQRPHPGSRVPVARISTGFWRNRQSSLAAGCRVQGSVRQGGGGQPRRGRHHRQQEHDSVRLSAAIGPQRDPHRHPCPDDPRHAGTGNAANCWLDWRGADKARRCGRGEARSRAGRRVVQALPCP